MELQDPKIVRISPEEQKRLTGLFEAEPMLDNHKDRIFKKIIPYFDYEGEYQERIINMERRAIGIPGPMIGSMQPFVFEIWVEQ